MRQILIFTEIATQQIVLKQQKYRNPTTEVSNTKSSTSWTTSSKVITFFWIFR